jgi:hypothetical protein
MTATNVRVTRSRGKRVIEDDPTPDELIDQRPTYQNSLMSDVSFGYDDDDI